MAATTLEPILLHLPDVLYRQVAKRAQRTNVSLEDELVTMVAATLSSNDDLPEVTIDAMTQLAFLDDEDLWRAAQLQVLPEENSRMQFLTTKRQAEGLQSEEQAEVEHLLQQFDHVMLVRAQAMALLRERGFDLSNLLSPAIAR